jgi:hypothetical protein
MEDAVAKFTVLSLMVLAVMGLASVTFAEEVSPGVLTCEMGVQFFFEEGNVRPGVTKISLWCALGDCTLSRVHLHECAGDTRQPFINTASTKEGTLRILSSQIGLPSSSGATPGIMLLEERYPAAWYHYNFPKFVARGPVYAD